MTAVQFPDHASHDPLRLRAVASLTENIELSNSGLEPADIVGLILVDPSRARGGRLTHLATRLRRAGWPVILCETDSQPDTPSPDIAPATPCLTPRERQVLVLIAQGLTNEQIAQELHISVNTLKTHIRTAYQKIGVERRTQAVTWCFQHLPETGLIPRSA